MKIRCKTCKIRKIHNIMKQMRGREVLPYLGRHLDPKSVPRSVGSTKVVPWDFGEERRGHARELVTMPLVPAALRNGHLHLPHEQADAQIRACDNKL